jgi:hypothetical protein
VPQAPGCLRRFNREKADGTTLKLLKNIKGVMKNSRYP